MDSFSALDIVINAVLALIMLGLGLSLTPQDFRNLFFRPRSLLTALVVQLFIVPGIAFFIAAISGLPNEVKVGMVIVSVCASGASSNLITHLLKGNLALAVSMTTINSIITLGTIPLIVNLALVTFMGRHAEINLPFGQTIIQIFIVTLIPASIGILIRYVKERVAHLLERPLKFILPVLLAASFTLKIFLGENSGGTGITFTEVINIIPFLFLLNVIAMTAGFFSGRAMRLPFRDQYSISVEVGLHNTALALVIAGSILNSPDMEKPAVIYAMFSFFSAVGFVLLIKYLYGKKNTPVNEDSG
jgi:bile acid:Na+ symporter, BASS family